jgi:hypothetical protein
MQAWVNSADSVKYPAFCRESSRMHPPPAKQPSCFGLLGASQHVMAEQEWPVGCLNLWSVIHWSHGP